MKKFIVAHFEKFLFGIVAVVCLALVIQNIMVIVAMRTDAPALEAFRAKVKIAVEAPTTPAIDPVPDYAGSIEERLVGGKVVRLAPIPGTQDLAYNREFQEKVPIDERVRFALLPPKAATMVVKAGYQVVPAVFDNDDTVPGLVVNTSRSQTSTAEDFDKHAAVVFAGLAQRRLVHDGKNALTDTPWETLTGSAADPRWADLEEPLTTTFLLVGGVPSVTDVPAAGSNQPVDDPDRYEGERDRMSGRGSRGRGAEAQVATVSLQFNCEDAGVEACKTYAYRFAVVAAMQKGVRLFRIASTPEDLELDEDAKREFNLDKYAPGDAFIGNPTIDKAVLVNKFNVTGLPELKAQPAAGSAKPDKVKGSKTDKTDAGAVVPFYLVRSEWSAETTATPMPDSDVYLSGELGGAVAVYIVKHYRFTYKRPKVDDPYGGGGYGPEPGGAAPAPRPEDMIEETAWVELLFNFSHIVGDRIGKEARLRTVGGTNFPDRQSRPIDFTTPWVIQELGRGDLVEEREIEDWIKNPVTGELELKKIKKQNIQTDVLFMVIRNIITDQTEKKWLVGGDVINRLRAAAAEAAARVVAQIQAAQQNTAPRAPRSGREERPPGPTGPSKGPGPKGPIDERDPVMGD
ncbi:MAG: hypothetical protein ABIF71_13805 [Planctomycetota bacterium]